MPQTASPPKFESASTGQTTGTRPARSKGLLVLESLCLIILAIAVTEWFLGVCGVGEQEFQLPDKRLGWRNAPGKLVSYRREGYSRGFLNAQGFRDVEHRLDKPPGTFRIALLGDSATEGMQVPFNQTATYQLQKQLNEKAAKAGLKRNFEVLNCGCSAYGTGQELVLYETKVRQYKPDMVVVLYTQGDAGESIAPLKSRAKARPRPYFYLDPLGNLHEDDAILAINDRDLQPNAVLDWLMYHSRIYGVLCKMDFELSASEPIYGSLRTLVMKPFQYKRQSPDTVLEALLPQNAIKVCSALITRFNQEVKQDGGTFVLVAFPNYMHFPDFYQEAKALLALSQIDGFPFLDLDQAFRRHQDPSELILRQHFSARGHLFETRQLINLIWASCAR